MDTWKKTFAAKADKSKDANKPALKKHLSRKPASKQTQQTIKENETFDHLQKQLGNKWSKIAHELEGRSDIDVGFGGCNTKEEVN